MNFSNIKNLVFDLGGVIINLDFNKTFDSFASLANATREQTIAQFEKEQFFKKYETGELTESEIFNLIRSKFCPGASDIQIRAAWDALLLDIPVKRVELLKKLREKYTLYLLSNTNPTHIETVNRILYTASGVTSLDQLFDKIYYSYEIKLAKPHKEIYDFVASDAKLDLTKSVFLDDTIVNLKGAEEAGWETVHVKEPLTILELLKDA